MNVSPRSRRPSTWLALFPLLLALAPAFGQPAPPTPTVTVEKGLTPLIGEPFTFTVTFDNTGGRPGFGPYLLLCLPVEGEDGASQNLPCDGASFVSATAEFSNRNLPLSAVNPPGQVFVPGGGPAACPPSRPGIDSHPICQGPLPLPPAAAQCQVVALDLPFGSLYPGQPPVQVQITADPSPFADLDKALPIYVQGGFRFGDSATGKTCLQGDVAETEVTPSLFHLTKSYAGPEDETATGPSFPRTYDIQVDVADGQTLEPLVVTDRLPDTIQLLSPHPECSILSAPPASRPGTPWSTRWRSRPRTTSRSAAWSSPTTSPTASTSSARHGSSFRGAPGSSPRASTSRSWTDPGGSAATERKSSGSWSPTPSPRASAGPSSREPWCRGDLVRRHGVGSPSPPASPIATTVRVPRTMVSWTRTT